MITTKKVGRKTEYLEDIRHSCGHVIYYTTLSHKIGRKVKAEMMGKPCARCYREELMI
jgi:hypothetical protein